MKYPQATLGGQTFDLYDIAEALGVTSPPLFNAFKKLVRRGNGAKSERQDLEEAKQSIDRYLRDKPPADPGWVHRPDCICRACEVGRMKAEDKSDDGSMP
jgi:hypothetical protein